LEALQEKKALLVLYFGPDSGAPSEEKTDLYDKTTNRGKNDQLVSFIDDLYSDIEGYHRNRSSLEFHRKQQLECYSCYFYGSDIDDYQNKEIKCVKDEYDTPFTEEDCEERKKLLETLINEYSNGERKLFADLRDLSEIMRIYMKNEWSHVKKDES